MQKFDFQEFVTALDAGQQAHLEWSRRILRCTVLRSFPDDDVMHNDAHHLCQFGQFLAQHLITFTSINAEQTQRLVTVHQQMHDTIRNLARPISQGLAGNIEDLEHFERCQAELIDHLAYFKTQAIYHYTQIDNLTGLPLRQRLIQEFRGQQEQCSGALALMFIDVDHFKSINDLYGHNMGDTVLQQLVLRIHDLLNIDQSMYRYGGEEFIIMLCAAQAKQAEALAELIRHTVYHRPIVHQDDATIQISVTIGVALARHPEPLVSVIERADKAMYYGKQHGRNRVINADHITQKNKS